METFDADVDLQGRVTIPKDVRLKLDIKRGDRVRVKDVIKLVMVEANPKGASSVG